jgi:hypothetical protein
MGRGPQELVYKKLISSYLKFNIKKFQIKPDETIVPKLLSSFNLYGDEHPEVIQLKKKLNEDLEKQQNEMNDLKKEVKTYPSIVEKYLNNIKHKGEKKGKHQIPADYYGEIKKDLRKLDI